MTDKDVSRHNELSRIILKHFSSKVTGYVKSNLIKIFLDINDEYNHDNAYNPEFISSFGHQVFEVYMDLDIPNLTASHALFAFYDYVEETGLDPEDAMKEVVKDRKILHSYVEQLFI